MIFDQMHFLLLLLFYFQKIVNCQPEYIVVTKHFFSTFQAARRIKFFLDSFGPSSSSEESLSHISFGPSLLRPQITGWIILKWNIQLFNGLFIHVY